jgi:c-di-GMP-binding flagellar brake protein YcgR
VRPSWREEAILLSKGALAMVSAEKRQFPRLVLKLQDGYFANFLLPDNAALVAPIINLSAGGLNMAVKPDEANRLQAGDQLVLKHIAGGANLAFLSEIKTEIRWIRSLNHPTYLFVGCRMYDMPADVHEQLAQFIHTERMARGQYD